jgi:hypothetical protein
MQLIWTLLYIFHMCNQLTAAINIIWKRIRFIQILRPLLTFSFFCSFYLYSLAYPSMSHYYIHVISYFTGLNLIYEKWYNIIISEFYGLMSQEVKNVVPEKVYIRLINWKVGKWLMLLSHVLRASPNNEIALRNTWVIPM